MKKLISLLNPQNVNGIENILEIEDKYLEEYEKNTDWLRDQCFIASMENDALSILEYEYKIRTDITDTYQNRRSRIIAKKRGMSTTTIAMIKNVALAYSCGEVDVIEHYTEYYITIRFVSIVGIPPKMEDFKDTMREIIPAHLGIAYEFKYNTWQDVFNLGEWQKTKDKGTWEDTRSKG